MLCFYPTPCDIFSCLCWWSGSERTWNCYVKLLEGCNWKSVLDIPALQLSSSLTTFIRCCIWEGGMCTDRAWPPCMFVKNTLGFSCSWLWPSNLLPCFADECTHGDTFLEPTMQNNTLGFKLPRLIDFSFEPWVPAKGHAVLGVCQLCGQSATTFVLSARVGIGRNTPSQVHLHYAWADGRQDQGAAVLELSVSQTNQPHIHVL